MKNLYVVALLILFSLFGYLAFGPKTGHRYKEEVWISGGTQWGSASW